MGSTKTTAKRRLLSREEPVIRNYYTSDISHPGTPMAKKGRTQQSFEKECNINNIVARFMKTGQLPMLNSADLNYGFAPSGDFKSAMDIVTGSLDKFADLPSEVRADFDNNPGRFLDFVESPEAHDYFAEHGLLHEQATERYIASQAVSGELPPPEAPPEPTTE